MPVVFAALIGGLVSAAGSITGRVLIALGVGYVSYQGIGALLSQFQTIFTTAAGGLSGPIAGMLGVLKIGTGLNIISSAVVARLTINGLTSGAMKRMVIK